MVEEERYGSFHNWICLGDAGQPTEKGLERAVDTVEKLSTKRLFRYEPVVDLSCVAPPTWRV